MDMDYKKHRHAKKSHGDTRARHAKGGSVEREGDHPEKEMNVRKKVEGKLKPKTKFKRGGEVEGEKGRQRADKRHRFARGGGHKGKEHTKVNVIVANGGQNPGSLPSMPAPKPPIAPPMPMKPPMGAPGGAGPMPGGPPPPGMGGIGPKPDMPPGGPGPLKRGGRACRAAGGTVGQQEKAHDRMRIKVDAKHGGSAIGRKLEREHSERHHGKSFAKDGRPRGRGKVED